MMSRPAVSAAILALPAASASAQLYINCNLGTGPTTLSGVGGLPAGVQWSEVARDTANPFLSANAIAGFAGTGARRLADDFVVPAGGMSIDYIRFPVYLTGSTQVSVTALTLQIWDGRPDAGGTVVFGDQTTNRLGRAEFAPYYRCFNTVVAPQCSLTTVPDHQRHIQWAYATVNQVLPAGTYWLDWNYTGATFSPSATIHTATGRQCNPQNANALQFNEVWAPCIDIGQGCIVTTAAQDLYFEIFGPWGAACEPDCDRSRALNVNDFICFQAAFAAGALAQADCDHNNALNINDFVCFQSAFAAGCSQL